MKKINCPNCGAPLVDVKCEYCGTDTREESGLKCGSEIKITPDGIVIRAGNFGIKIP